MLPPCASLLGLLAVLLAVPLRAQPLLVPDQGSDDRAAQTQAMLEAWQTTHHLDRPLADALLLAEQASAADEAVVKRWLAAIFADLDRKIRARHSARKKARTIHRHLHRDVLQAYADDATLVRAAREGVYTVPLAATLFKLIADRYAVPVQLRFARVHVFATLADDEQDVRLEAFDRDHGLEAERREEDVVEALDAYGLLSPYVLDAIGLDPALTPLEAYRLLTAEAQPLSDAQLVGVFFGGVPLASWPRNDSTAPSRPVSTRFASSRARTPTGATTPWH